MRSVQQEFLDRTVLPACAVADAATEPDHAKMVAYQRNRWRMSPAEIADEKREADRQEREIEAHETRRREAIRALDRPTPCLPRRDARRAPRRPRLAVRALRVAALDTGGDGDGPPAPRSQGVLS